MQLVKRLDYVLLYTLMGTEQQDSLTAPQQPFVCLMHLCITRG